MNIDLLIQDQFNLSEFIVTFYDNRNSIITQNLTQSPI